MIFPTIVYKDGGPHQRPGGTYSYVGAQDNAAFDRLIGEGWFPSLTEALAGKVVAEPGSGRESKPEIEEDNSPPTREEIEKKAKELGIKVHHKHTDQTLLGKIKEKLSELD